MGGWVELYPIFFWIFGKILTLQSPLVLYEFFHAMSTKRTVLSLDQRMKVLRRLGGGASCRTLAVELKLN